MRSQAFLFVATATLAAVVAALPTASRHVLHERRSGSSSWAPDDRFQPDRGVKLPVRIGLAESNLHLGHDLLMGVSSPDSELYGKHWTADQVRYY